MSRDHKNAQGFFIGLIELQEQSLDVSGVQRNQCRKWVRNSKKLHCSKMDISQARIDQY